MRKPILLALKQKKVNHVHICSSAPITVKITRQTPTCVHFENIGSIENGTSRNITRSIKTDSNRSVQM